MGAEGVDVAVEVAKANEPEKSFKEAVDGGKSKSPNDVLMEEIGGSKQKPDQSISEAGTSKKSHKKLKNGCLAKTVENLRYKVTSPLVGDYTQYMTYHALIGKFMGIWPIEKALLVWIKSKWKVKGDIILKLSSKSFFTTLFTYSKDRNRIFDEGPYFFNSARIHLGYWSEHFSPEKEDFTAAPVWIRLYSLPHEFWHLETLEGLGNTLGSFVKISKITKVTKYTSYARICVYMNVTTALPESITTHYFIPR